MSNSTDSLTSIRFLYDVGQPLFYACLYPKFDWFDKEFSIHKIIEPVEVRVTKQSIFPDRIENDDRFLLSRIGFSGVARKYSMHVYLDNDEMFSADIFENTHKKTIVIFEKHVTVGRTIEVVEEDFYRMVIQTKADLEFDDETKIIRDSKFNTFRNLYSYASDTYPEEVIKSHDQEKH